MDLAGISAITAVVVAATGIPVALVVGRWQMRGALVQAERAYRAPLDAAQAVAASNHDHWRRSVRRDAYVQFLLSTSELDRIALPANGTTTHVAAEEAVKEALHRATTAYYLVRLESIELATLASQLLRAVEECAAGKTRWAAYMRARRNIERIESETHTVWDDVHEALGRLHTAAAPGTGGDDREQLDELRDARNDAQQTLLHRGLSDGQITALVQMQTDPVNVRVLARSVNAARRAFLRAAHRELNGPAAMPSDGPPAL